jgi:hypothetical protein
VFLTVYTEMTRETVQAIESGEFDLTSYARTFWDRSRTVS